MLGRKPRKLFFLLIQNLNIFFLIIAIGTVILYLYAKHVENKLAFDNQHTYISDTYESPLYAHIRNAFALKRLDSYGNYRILNDVYVRNSKNKLSKNSSSENKLFVTLVSQCSINHLGAVIYLADYWKGLISLSVFIPSNNLQDGIKYLLYLHKCHRDKLSRTSIHFVRLFPDVGIDLPRDYRTFTQGHQFDCVRDFQFDKYRTGNYNSDFYRYPNNLLRNVAIRAASTEYVFVLDIDMVPSYGLDLDLHEFLRHLPKNITEDKKDMLVFVVPAFEQDIGDTDLPMNKTELVKMFEYGRIRPFYSEVCPRCQNLVNYDKWKDLSKASSLQASYYVEWADPWEPFFIAPRNGPLYDERFSQYGFNRRSQICELHTTGYKFAVLNNAFIIHQGFKNSWNFHRNKDIENEENRLLFTNFKQELMTKYNLSDVPCS